MVIDTLPHIWPVVNENDAGETLETLAPLRGITEAGAALLLAHHPRKGDGGQATATRGSGALTGWVDIIIELRRHDPQNMSDTRRTLSGFGRYESTPKEMVIDLGEDGYTMLGEREDVNSADTETTIIECLPAEGDGLTFEQIHDVWPKQPKPGKTGLRATLNEGSETGKWERRGSGVKNSPHRFRRIEEKQDSFRSDLSGKGRNESEGDEGVAETAGE